MPERIDYIISVTDASRGFVAAKLAALDVTPSETFSEAFTGFQVALTGEKAAIIQNTPGVELLEAISLKAKAVDSQENPPSWNLDRLDQDPSIDNNTDVHQYWYPKSAGQGARVYVMDTGVVAARTGFNGRVTDGFDATYQGYLDRRAGLATFDNYNSTGSATNDCSGHGNGVASVVAGDTTGVAKKATIVPVRVLNCDGRGSNADIIRGIEWIMAHHPAGTTGIINMSFGYVDKDVTYTCDPNFPKECNYPTIVEQTVAAAVDAGFFVAAAAGNDSEPSTAALNNPAASKTVLDACDFTPARVPGVFTVGASDGGYDGTPERRATFSNAGQCVDGFAPGVNIRGFHRTSDSILTLSRGTSVAAPHVAGLAALLVAENPTITSAQITSQLKAAAVTGALTDTAAYPLNANTQYSTGATLVNGTYLRYTTVSSVSPNLIVRSAITTPVRATAVTDVTLANRSSSTLEISFAAPANAVEAGVTDYRVSTKNLTDDTVATTIVPSTTADGSTATSTTITDLVPNTPYQVTITALADGYVGVSSTTLNATTDLVYSAPDAPINPPSLLPGDAAHANTDSNIWVTYSTPTITASASTGNSPITGAVVRYSKDGQTWTETHTLEITATAYQQVTLSNLARATTYQVQYAWVNAYGLSGWSDVATSTTGAVAPTAPLAVHRTAATGNSLSLAWDPPASNGGYIVSDYQVRYGAAIGTSCAGVTFSTVNVHSDDRAFTITGLTGRTNYCVYVKAYTAFGWGGLSAVLKTATTVDPTNTPEGLAVQPGVDRAIITWASPTADGGQAAWDYTIEMSSNNGDTWTVFQDGISATTSLTLTGLNLDSTYQVRISARNDGGLSAASAPLTFATVPAPALTPASELAVTKITKNSLALNWTETNAGAAASSIAGYKIYISSTGHAPEIVPTVAGTTSTTVTNLLPGTEYTLYIVTQSIYGTTSEASATIDGTTLTGLATAPRFVTLSVTSTTSSALSWVVPESDGGDTITAYLVRLSTDGGQTWTNRIISSGTLETSLNRSLLTATLNGLATGATYTATVAAVNFNGTGANSETVSGLVATPPSPTIARITHRTISSLTLAWDPAEENGAPVTEYRVETFNGNTWTALATLDAASLEYTVSNLQRATSRTFRITAVNAVGLSAPSHVAGSTEATVPGAVTSFTVVPGTTTLDIGWIAPSDNGGAPVTGYSVEYKAENSGNWTTVSVFAEASTYVASGLNKGTTYTVRLYPINQVGAADSVSVNSRTLTTVATSVTELTATTSSPAETSSVELTWAAPADSGGNAVAGYTVAYRITGQGSWTTINTVATSMNVAALNNGTSYEFTVAAVTADGTGTPASISISTGTVDPPTGGGTPAAAPDPVIDLNVSRTGSSALVVWVAPLNNGGVEISGYIVKFRAYGTSEWTETTVLVRTTSLTGLEIGTAYEISVAATNSVGSSRESVTATNLGANAPDAPLSIAAVKTASSVQVNTVGVALNWAAPVNNGGATITSYIVEYQKVGAATRTVFAHASPGTSAILVTGLTKGTSYTFRVSAVNSVGIGAAISVSATTDADAPNPPSKLSIAFRSRTSLTISWFKPTATGGAAITDYIVTYRASNSNSWKTFNDAVRAGTGATITGLSANKTYFIRIYAVNDSGKRSQGALLTAKTSR